MNIKRIDEDVTLLINSCDIYADAWEPFLELLHLQWDDCPSKIVINTESKEYKGKFPHVRTIMPKRNDLTWSQRLKYVLERIDTPYVLFFLEDYFLLSKVNSEVFVTGIDVLNSNNHVGMICMSQTNRKDIKTPDYEDDNFYSRIINRKCKIWCRINLYRTGYLLKLLREHESIWEFEQYASYRAKKMGEIILQQNNSRDEIFNFKIKLEDGYGISRRKWLPKNVELFKQYNIDVNFEGLGFWFPQNMIKGNTNCQHQDANQLVEILYRFKRMPFKLKKKFAKQIRVIKSKH